MCYSEELKREAGGHLVGTEWVLTGWKTIQKQTITELVSVTTEEVKLAFRLSKSSGYKWKPVFHQYMGHEEYEKESVQYCSWYDTSYLYEFDKVLHDSHGFHVAATKKGAEDAQNGGVGHIAWNPNIYCTNATFQSVYGWNAEIVEPPKRKVKGEIVTCRVLVRESSVKDNHAHVMMILKPGHMETEEQINMVAGIVRPKQNARISIDWATEQIEYSAISKLDV